MPTGIEWTEESWNPFVGCTINSAGCRRCYAMREAYRMELRGIAAYQGTTRLANGRPVWTGLLNRGSENQRTKPLRLKEPTRIFVNSMSDFFHTGAPDEWRVEALEIMENTPRHQYQILTKLPQNILPFQNRAYRASFPPNIWLGVSVERADVAHRIESLRQINCAVRFISFEPLIGPLGALDLTGFQWAIIGGESGPEARAMWPEWAREALALSRRYGLAIFFKQWGIPQNNPLYHTAPLGIDPGQWVRQRDPVGKGGSLLDGREWKQYPKAA